MANLSIRDLKKAGFVICPEKNFSDDGNHFKMLQYKGMYVSYLKADGMYYISPRGELDCRLVWQEYSKLPSYAKLDIYNGTDYFDAEKLTKTIISYLAEYEEKVVEVRKIEFDIDALFNQLDKEEAFIKELLKDVEELRLFEAPFDKDSLDTLRTCYTRLSDMNFNAIRKALIASNVSEDNRDLRSIMYNFLNRNYIRVARDNYYVKKLITYLENFTDKRYK